MVSADQVNDHTIFLWHCLKSAQDNGGKIDNKTIGQHLNLKPNAIYMRLFRLSKAIETMSGAQRGDDVGHNNDGSEKAAVPKAKIMGKAGSKKRTAEQAEFHDDAEKEKNARPKPSGKAPKLTPAEIKSEMEDEDKAGYDNGGTATDDDEIDGI